jgi:hypothetical protein
LVIWRGHPNSPTSICGAAVTYDANGNITSYDPDGAAGSIPACSLVYDLENRPVSVTQNGNTAFFADAADSSRAGKFIGAGKGARKLLSQRQCRGCSQCGLSRWPLHRTAR